MRFDYRRVESLPRLSWCAEISKGSPVVRVVHGAWIETRGDRFFEGAWNGDFKAGDFDRSETFAGSGGLFRKGQLVFSPPTDTYMWLVVLRTAGSLFVSNSLVFAMRQAGDEPAVNYPYYFFDVMHHRRWGLRQVPLAMPTRRGNSIDLMTWNNFIVRQDLSIEVTDRKRADAFDTYAEYKQLLFATVRDVVDNAANPDRIQPFRPLAAVSQGYDSPACAVAMAAAGCREALTYSRTPPAPGGLSDNGKEIARYLGLNTRVYHREEYDVLDGLQDAEFCATATSGSGAPLVLAEPQLQGTILSSGRPGGYLWTPDELHNVPDLMSGPVQTTNSTSIMEFRLRCGYLHFAVPYIGAVHRASVMRITRSEEMKPWWTSGSYNRPIPRRMTEEAGVPGQMFGQKKMGSNQRASRTIPEAAKRDFDAFYERLDVPAVIRKGRLPLWEYRKAPLDALYAIGLYFPDPKKRLYRWLLPFTLKSDRRAGASMPLSDLYLFHWGFEKIKHRYDIS